jgi:hypothetical protein
MDPGCWEVKWENRNDCLSALMASSTETPYASLMGLIHFIQTLRNIPHLTVTWPHQQHALIRRRGGPNRSHQIKDHLMFKRQTCLQQNQTQRCDGSTMASQIVTSLSSPGSWDDEVNTAAATVGSQSSLGRLSAPNDGDPPITTDDWNSVEAGSCTDFQAALSSVPDTATSEQLQVIQAVLRDAPSEAKDKQLKRSDKMLHVDGIPSSQSSNPQWSELVSDSTVQSQGEVTLSSA